MGCQCNSSRSTLFSACLVTMHLAPSLFGSGMFCCSRGTLLSLRCFCASWSSCCLSWWVLAAGSTTDMISPSWSACVKELRESRWKLWKRLLSAHVHCSMEKDPSMAVQVLGATSDSNWQHFVKPHVVVVPRGLTQHWRLYGCGG